MRSPDARSISSATLQVLRRLQMYVSALCPFPEPALIAPTWETDIGECVNVLRDTVKDDDLAPIPIFGNGDAYDHRSYWDNVEQSGVDGIMIARGALIKPWIFTELKERRDCESAVVKRSQVFLSLTSICRGHLVAGASRHDRETVQLWTRALGMTFLHVHTCLAHS